MCLRLIVGCRISKGFSCARPPVEILMAEATSNRERIKIVFFMAMLSFQFLNVIEPRRGLLGDARRLRYLRFVYKLLARIRNWRAAYPRSGASKQLAPHRQFCP